MREPTADALQRLRKLARLAADWDSYAASPLSQDAVGSAERLVLEIVERCGAAVGHTSVPSFIAPIADGGVQLEWDGPGGHLEVEISPEGSLSYLLVQESERGRLFEEQDEVSSQQVFALVARVLGSPTDG